VRFKLDENLDPRLSALVREDGHDVETVLSEGLSGSNDEVVYDVCLQEARVLITLDLDFSNPFRFPPGVSDGIVVVRPTRPTIPRIRAILAAALPSLKQQALRGKLWIVEPGRIRFYDPEEDVL
jgi:predicted nuclease of predicted toxin-antitoxin system